MKITADVAPETVWALRKFAQENNCNTNTLVNEALDDYVKVVIPARSPTNTTNSKKVSQFGKLLDDGIVDISTFKPPNEWIN